LRLFPRGHAVAASPRGNAASSTRAPAQPREVYESGDLPFMCNKCVSARASLRRAFSGLGTTAQATGRPPLSYLVARAIPPALAIHSTRHRSQSRHDRSILVAREERAAVRSRHQQHRDVTRIMPVSHRARWPADNRFDEGPDRSNSPNAAS